MIIELVFVLFFLGPYAAFGIESEQESLFKTRNDKHIYVSVYSAALPGAFMSHCARPLDSILFFVFVHLCGDRNLYW